MIILPIVERELRVNARRKPTYSGRVVTAAVCTVVGLGSALTMARTGFNNRLGTALFASVAGMTAMFGLFIGAGSTSDSISGEKREGTLGLLFLTGLRPHDIVLGKLAACSLMSFYGLLTVMPILSLGVLLGGVQLQQVGLMALALFNTLFFSATLGMFTSTLTRRADRAGAAAMGGAMFFWFGCGALAQVLGQFNLVPKLVWLLRVISPQYPVELALTSTTPRVASWYWTPLLTSHALGWLFLGGAVLVLPRVWQDRVAGPKGLPFGERWAQRRLGDPIRRLAHRQAAMAINPFYWLAARQPRQHLDVWWFLGLVALLIVAVVWYYGSVIDYRFFGVFMVAAVHFVLRLWVANESGRRLAEERHNGTLEMLLSTPLSVPEIIRGQGLALRRLFAWPVGAVGAADLAFAGFLPWHFGTGPPQPELVLLVMAAVAVLLLDAVALFYAAMWAALTEKRAQAVAGNAVLRVLFLPWLVLFAILISRAFLSGGGPGPPLSGRNFAIIWFALSVTNSLFWFERSRTRLLAEFRARAMDRFLAEEDKPGLWARWGHWLGNQFARRFRR